MWQKFTKQVSYLTKGSRSPVFCVIVCCSTRGEIGIGWENQPELGHAISLMEMFMVKNVVLV